MGGQSALYVRSGWGEKVSAISSTVCTHLVYMFFSWPEIVLPWPLGGTLQLFDLMTPFRSLKKFVFNCCGRIYVCRWHWLIYIHLLQHSSPTLSWILKSHKTPSSSLYRLPPISLHPMLHQPNLRTPPRSPRNTPQNPIHPRRHWRNNTHGYQKTQFQSGQGGV